MLGNVLTLSLALQDHCPQYIRRRGDCGAAASTETFESRVVVQRNETMLPDGRWTSFINLQY